MAATGNILESRALSRAAPVCTSPCGLAPAIAGFAEALRPATVACRGLWPAPPPQRHLFDSLADLLLPLQDVGLIVHELKKACEARPLTHLGCPAEALVLVKLFATLLALLLKLQQHKDVPLRHISTMSQVCGQACSLLLHACAALLRLSLAPSTAQRSCCLGNSVPDDKHTCSAGGTREP